MWSSCKKFTVLFIEACKTVNKKVFWSKKARQALAFKMLKASLFELYGTDFKLDHIKTRDSVVGSQVWRNIIIEGNVLAKGLNNFFVFTATMTLLDKVWSPDKVVFKILSRRNYVMYCRSSSDGRLVLISTKTKPIF